MFKCIILLCFLSSLVTASSKIRRGRFLEENDYQQIGENIISPTSDEHGGDVDISFDGNFVAIGSPHAGDEDRGEVKIYQSVFKNGVLIWEQLGNTIVGANPLAHTGISVALSWEAKTLAVGSLLDESERGSAEVYRYDEACSEWKLIDTKFGENDKSAFGRKVQLSSNGKILAVSGNSIARVYKCYKVICEERGGSLTIDDNDFIRDIALSSGGQSLAIGSIPLEENTPGTGTVQLYDFRSSEWILSKEFSGESGGDKTGFSVSLSSDGGVIAFGSFGFQCLGINDRKCGRTDIFIREGNSFTQLGDKIIGSLDRPLLGIDIDLSADGRRIIVTSGNAVLQATPGNEVLQATATIYSLSEGLAPEWRNIQELTAGGGILDNSFSAGSQLDANGNRAIVFSPGQQDTDTNVIAIFDDTSEVTSIPSLSSTPPPTPIPSPQPTSRVTSRPTPSPTAAQSKGGKGKGSKVGKKSKTTKTKGGGKGKGNAGAYGAKKGRINTEGYALQVNCENDLTFRFNLIERPLALRKCSYIGQIDEHIAKYCSNKEIARKCERACKLC